LLKLSVSGFDEILLDLCFSMIFILLVVCFPVVHTIRTSKTDVSARRPWAEMSELEQYWEAAWWTNATYDQTDAHEHAILDTRYVSSNHQECVLGFRGTKDMKDWAYNLDIQVVQWDIWSVHKGFATKLQKVMNDNVELINGLTNCSALIVLGHSLGGAMASLYAAGAEKYGYRKADYLYTFGAPAISTSSLHDDFNCFEGARFYNLDSITHYDLVPNVANWAGFYHPKLKAVWLSTGNVVNGMEEYQNMAFPCDDTKTPHRPGVYASTSLTMFLAGYPNQPLPLHKMTTYFERVNRIVMAAVGGAA